MSIFDTTGAALIDAENHRYRDQVVGQPNAEIALKSLMDAELALTKARDLLRRARDAVLGSMSITPLTTGLVADINDLLGD